MKRALPAPLLLAAALAFAGPASAQDDAGGAPPDYALPSGLPGPGSLGEPLQDAVDRAVRDVLRPRNPWAAREGGRVLAGVGPRAAAAATAALRGADWHGRSLLVRALGGMADPRLVPLLVQAAGDPAWAVREAAAEGLSHAADPVSASVLAGLLGDRAWRVRRAALASLRARVLRGAADGAAAGAAILPLAEDPDPDVRVAAWLALADLRDPGAKATLERVLLEMHGRVQASDDEDAMDPLLRVAVRVLRGWAGAAPADPGVRETLLRIGSTPGHALAGHALREWCRAAPPGEASSPESVARLVAVYMDPDADIDSRYAAERTLLGIGPPAAAGILSRVAAPALATRGARPSAWERQGMLLLVRVAGEEVGPMLARLFGDRDLPFSTRVHAAEIARRFCARGLGTEFREVLARGEGHSELDAQLLKGVAASGGADAGAIVAKALVRTGGNEPAAAVREAAAEVIETRPGLCDREVLLRALSAENDPDILVRLLPVFVSAAGPDAAAAVAPFLRDRRARVRRAAAGAISRGPGPAAVRVLLEALEREDGEDDRLPWFGEGEPTEAQKAELREVRRAHGAGVREAIVGSLRFAAGESAGAELRALLSHGDPSVRGAAAGNLSTLGDPAAAEALAARVPAEAEPAVRTRLLEALASLGGPAADAAFESFLAGADEGLRVEALEALGDEEGRARARAPEGVLRSALRAEGGAIERLAALRALGREGDPARTPVLLELLGKSPAGEERRAVLHAIGRSRDPAAAAPVAALLPPEDPSLLDPDAMETLATALETLGELRAAEAARPLAAVLDRSLPAALAGGGGRGNAAGRQAAVLAVRALGRCGGDEALGALVRAAFHPGFSRAAESATADPLRRAVLRKEDEAWRPALPDDLRVLGLELTGALARWRDGELRPAIDRALESLREDGRVFAVSEEWLSWLGAWLGDPPGNLPYRPRWLTKTALLAQVEANPPRASEADLVAASAAFVNEAQNREDYAAAAAALRRWGDLLRVHDPLRAERESGLLEGYRLDVEAAARLKAGGGDPADLLDAFARGGREDRVARLGVEILQDLRAHLDTAVALGELAVRSHAEYPPNHRSLGVARLWAGDAAGAAEALGAAVSLFERDGGEEARLSAWTRLWRGVALLRLGREEDALESLARGARLDDNVLEWCERAPDLEPLRKDGRLDDALEEARRVFER